MEHDPATQRMIADLRKFQIFCEERIQGIITRLNEEAKLRLVDYKEAEELSRRAGKMSNRWRRLTALTVEGLVELDREILHEETECAQLRHNLKEDAPQIQEMEDEIKSMENLAGLMRFMIARGGDGGSTQLEVAPQTHTL